MGARRSSVDRVLAAQRQMQRAAEQAMAELRQRSDGLAADEQEVLAAFDGEPELRGALARSMAQRLGRLAAEGAALSGALERQAGALREQRRRVLGAERLNDAETARARRDGEAAALAELIDLVAARPSSSSR